MIQLHPDCLIFETSKGEFIPCSAETVTIELMGDAAEALDPAIVEEASAAVVHYFTHEVGCASVSLTDFAQALGKVLTTLGFTVSTEHSLDAPEVAVAAYDLRRVGENTSKIELAFFNELRGQLAVLLKDRPQVIRFFGLRGCVKELVGAQRWGGRCQELNDQIIDFLRQCFEADEAKGECRLVVQS